MATQIINWQYGDSVFTSDFREIQVSTSELCIPVTISCALPQPTVIFSTSLYSFKESVTLDDPGTIVEQYFRQHRLVEAPVTITLGNTAVTVNCIYCDYRMPRTFSLSGKYFSLLRTHRVHSGSQITLAAHYLGPEARVVLQAVGRDSEGNIASTNAVDIGKIPESGTITYFVDNIINTALNQGNVEMGADLVEIACFTLTYGTAVKTFYLVTDPEYLTFSFRNIFNAVETIDIVGIVKTKTSVTRDSAVCRGVTTQYNQITQRQYEVQTAALPLEEARMIDQLFNSRQVRLLAAEYFDNDEDVIITDHTCDIDNNDEALATVKFTFRFAPDRVRLFGDDLVAFTRHPRIFTQEYTQQYT